VRKEQKTKVEELFDYKTIHDDEFYEEYVEKFEQNKKNKWFYRFVKRFFDLILSFLMLIVFSPLFLIIAVAIKCDSKGKVVFSQKRVGKNGKEFTCYKFRSMITEAPKNCATSCLDNPNQYLTKVGRILRKLSLDELPQLWCVFIGTMSFVGYRPLVLTEKKCNILREKLGVFALKPGITGFAQVHGRDDVYYKNKALLDAEYVKRASLFFDLKILLKTVVVVLKKEGNDANKENEMKLERNVKENNETSMEDISKTVLLSNTKDCDKAG